MKTPLDCQLLKLGLDFVRSAKQNELQSCLELICDDDCKRKAGILVASENYRSLLENFSFIHADVEAVKVRVKFGKDERQTFCQTLLCRSAPDANGELRIQVR